MDCRLVDLPLSIRCIVKDGVIYLNARHPWGTLEKALREAQHLSNKKSATVAT